jgi:branched-chain amino acid transport system substrate-binding protein
MPDFFRRFALRSAIGLFALAICITSARADETFRVGVLTDMSGMARDLNGPSTVTAAQMAIDDFGGSVLGRKIELLVADHQWKPDVAMSIARQWFSADNVHAIFDVNSSAAALAIQGLAREDNKIVVFTSAASEDLTNKACSPNGFHWMYDNYSLSHAVTRAIVASGGTTWYFITADYASGTNLEREAAGVVTASGGQVLGESRLPIGTTDFSSSVIQAQASGAKVIGFANSGVDLVNAVKQVREFGLTAQIATFLLFVPDVRAVGLQTMQGIRFVDGFYWDLNDATRTWSKRFFDRMHTMPSSQQAAIYSGMTHYLKAVQAVGSDDTLRIQQWMHSHPVNDFATADATIAPNGRVFRTMYLFQVKSPEESKGPWDLFKVIRTIPAAEAFRPPTETECPLVARN